MFLRSHDNKQDVLVAVGLALVLLLVLMPVPGRVRAQEDAGPTLHEELAPLAPLLGEWTVSGRAMDDDGWLEVSGVARYAIDLDGNAIRGEVVLAEGDQRREVVSQYVYSPGRRQISAIWASSAATGIQIGTLNGGGNSFRVIAAGVGAQHEVRVELLDEGHLSVIFARAERLGQPVTDTHQLTYRRADEPLDEALARLREDLPVPAPPARTDEFDFFVGDWRVLYSRYISRAGEPAEVSDAEARVRAILGGHAYEQHWEGQLQMEDAVAWTLIRYQPDLNGWEFVWWDSDFGAAVRLVGDCSARACVFDEVSFQDISPQEFTWTWEPSLSSSWVMEYVRVTEAE